MHATFVARLYDWVTGSPALSVLSVLASFWLMALLLMLVVRGVVDYFSLQQEREHAQHHFGIADIAEILRLAFRPLRFH